MLGKGGKQRQVPVGTPARQALAQWMRERTHLATEGEPALFVGHHGKRWSASARYRNGCTTGH
ncbi:MAG: hypothetical protein ACT4PG_03835 [Panacagrimonas sp.]